EGATGADAISLAAAHQPAVMVLDASMPDMDGLEALPAILAASPTTRVVMFSGFGGTALEIAARTLGAAAFVEKSIPLRELPARLLEVVGAEEPGAPGDGHAGSDESQAVLAQHLERFRTVFDQAAIGMATMTLAGTVVRVNPALARLTGDGEAALIGRRYFHLTGGRPDDAVRAALRRVADGEQETAEVEHALHVRGERRWVRSTITVVRDPEGRPLYLFAQAEDVTVQRKAMDELRASEERFRLLVESVVDYAIFMLDPGGHISTWNIGAQRMKGYRADEIVGQHFRIFYPPEAQAIRHPEHELEIAKREGRYEEEGWRVRKDGTAFWANVVITALFDHEHHLVGFGKVTRDITERRRAEAARDLAAVELGEANQRLRAANEETADFLAITAHELRSPIVAMTGAADLLASHWAELTDDQRQENFRNLSRSGERTRRLREELLMASRLEAGQLEVGAVAVSLTGAAAEAAAGLGETVKIVGDDLLVRADRIRVVQMLANLLGNAVRYGEPPFVVEISPSDAGAVVRVCDAGPGVDPEL